MALRHFSAEELVIDNEQSRRILLFFWPYKQDGINNLSLNDTDRSFAQALLTEAVDRSEEMSIVKTMFDKFLYPPANYKAIQDGAKTVVKAFLKVAVHRNWLKKSGKINPDKVEIFDSVRITLASNFVGVMDERIRDGEYTGY